MAKVLAVGGPKGGVGKSTVALNTATYAARILGLRTLLADADPNRSSLDTAMAAGAGMPFEVAEGIDHDALVELHRSRKHDLVVVDLPGARETGALQALLKQQGSRAAADAVILPTRPKVMDLRPLRRVIRAELEPIRVPYLVALVRVHPNQVTAMGTRREEIRGAWGLRVADTYTRMLDAHDDALERHKHLMDMPGGRRSTVRAAEREYRALAAECLEFVGIEADQLREEPEEK